jgi:hypothetical protein
MPFFNLPPAPEPLSRPRRVFVEPRISEPRSLVRESVQGPMMALLGGSGGGVGNDPFSSFPPDGGADGT